MQRRITTSVEPRSSSFREEFVRFRTSLEAPSKKMTTCFGSGSSSFNEDGWEVSGKMRTS